MRKLKQRPSATLELLRGARPSGPIRFCLNDVAERERPAVYRDFFGRSVVNIDVEPTGDAPLEVDVTLQTLPGLRLLSGHVHGSRNRRTRELLADGKGGYSLLINLGGPYLLSQHDDELMLGDGDATLMTTADPCSFMHRPPGGVVALYFSRERISPLVEGAEDRCLKLIPAGTPALKLLTDYIEMASDERTVACSHLQDLFVSHVYDLAAAAIGASRDGARHAQEGGLRAARLYAIKQDIAKNLDSADLSVAELAARHLCTPRFVQRLFENEGTTFTEYLLAQRLGRAYRLLGDRNRNVGKISTVAYDCGFGDVSYFNRAFRRRYGAAPSEVRERAASGLSPRMPDEGYNQVWSI